MSLRTSSFINTGYKQARLRSASNQSISSIIAVASLVVITAAIRFRTSSTTLVLARNMTSYVLGYYKQATQLPIRQYSRKMHYEHISLLKANACSDVD